MLKQQVPLNYFMINTAIGRLIKFKLPYADLLYSLLDRVCTDCLCHASLLNGSIIDPDQTNVTRAI